MRPCGYEVNLLKAQLSKGAGIVACEEYRVFSSGASIPLADGIDTISFPSVAVGISADGTSGNSGLFKNVWEAVKTDGRWLHHDWTVKVDPDAVFLPDRLRGHVRGHTGESVYFRNCNQVPGSSFPMMYGALEALSRTAVE